MKIHEKLLAIQLKLEVPKTHFNKFGDFNYRSCEDILNALKPLLKEYKCTLTLNDSITTCKDCVYIFATAKLVDTEENGEVSATAYAREEVARPKMSDPQLTGSASSYARKYALNGLFLIDDVQDADTYTEPQPEQKNEKPAYIKNRDSIKILGSQGDYIDITALPLQTLERAVTYPPYAPIRKDIEKLVQELKNGL